MDAKQGLVRRFSKRSQQQSGEQSQIQLTQILQKDCQTDYMLMIASRHLRSNVFFLHLRLDVQDLMSIIKY
jgi:hypothetical protein